MRLNRTFAFAAVSLLGLTQPAFAQDSAEGEEAAIDDGIIIVEARRRAENVQEVPQVVNVVTSEQLGNLNIRTAAEITSLVPGLSLTANANGIGSSSSMRGVNHDVNVSGESGTIQYYVNDVPVNSGLVLQTMFDIGQITVERGPQGTLRGRSTPSGAININWRKPDLSEIGAYVTGTYGSDHTSNLNFGIGVPIIEDKLAVRVSGLTDRNRGNRVRSVNSTVLPSTKTDAIRAMVRAQPIDAIKLGFVYQSMKTNAIQFDQVQSMSEVIPGFVLPTVGQSITGSIAPFGAPAIPAQRASNYGTITLADRLAVQFTPRSVVQTFSYYGWDAEVAVAGQRLIYIGSSTKFKFNPVTNNDNGAIYATSTLQQRTNTVGDSITHEIRLQNADRVAGMFDYVVGYFQSRGSPATDLTTEGILEGYAPIFAGAGNLQMQRVATIVNPTAITLPKGTGSEKSYFGNVIVHLGDATEVSGGLRHVNFKNAAAGLYISCTPAQFAAGGCTLTPGTNNSFDVSKTVYSAAIRHKFSDDLMVYAASGSSFRPPVRAIGDFSTRYSPLEVIHTAFGPETSKSYEVGFKSQWLDRKVTFNATLYHQTFENYPFRAAGAGVYFINVDAQGQDQRSQFNFISAVPVKVNGVEADLAYNPSRQFSLSTTLNWSKSTIDKNAKIACTDVNRDGIPDTTAPTLAQMQAAYGTEHLAQCGASGSATFLPEWSASVRAEYNLPVTDGADLYVRGLVNYRGSTANDPQNPFDNVGSYALINLYAGLRSSNGAWEIGGYVKNVGNVTRLTQGNDNVYTSSTTLLNFTNFRPFGSQLYSSYYRGVSVNAPREVGVSVRVALGSR
jgi:iron complex outermembrane receptor protein